MKFCTDCKHYKDNDACRAPQNLEAPDPVDGKRGRRWRTCSIQREDGFVWALLLRSCGRRARWFSPANDKSAAVKVEA